MTKSNLLSLLKLSPVLGLLALVPPSYGDADHGNPDLLNAPDVGFLITAHVPQGIQKKEGDQVPISGSIRLSSGQGHDDDDGDVDRRKDDDHADRDGKDDDSRGDVDHRSGDCDQDDQHGLIQSLKARGYQITATFPDATSDVTSQVKFCKQDDRITYHFTTPALQKATLNTFDLSITAQSDKVRDLEKTQSRLDTRVLALTNTISELSLKARPPVAEIQALTQLRTFLQSLSSRISQYLASQPTVLAERRLPLQVGYQVAAPSYRSTIMGKFRLELSFTPGAQLSNGKAAVHATVTNLIAPHWDDFYSHEKSDSDATWVIRSLWQGQTVNETQPTQIAEGASVSFDYSTGALSSPAANTPSVDNVFSQEVFAWVANRKKGTGHLGDEFAHLKLHEPVSQTPLDIVPPVFLSGSTPDASHPYVQTSQPVSAKLLDPAPSSGINPASLGAILSGTLTSGAALSQDVTALLSPTLTDSGTGATFAGTLPSLSDGLYTLTESGADNAGNLAKPLTTSWRLDTTPPQVTLSQPVATCTALSTAQLLLVVSDWSPVTVTLSDNGSQITTQTLSPASATQQLSTQLSLSVDLTSSPVHNLSVTAVDAAGNALRNPLTAQVLYTPNAPVITLGTPDNIHTNKPAFSFSVTAQDPNLTSIVVSQNGSQIFSSSTSPITVNATLFSGANAFAVTATDCAGNTSQAQLTSIILDQTPPVLTISTPSLSTQYLNTRSVAVSGSANKPLVSATVNGTPLTLDSTRTHFSGQVMATSDGAFPLSWLITDRAGNPTTQTQQLTIDTLPPVIQASLSQPYYTNQSTLSLPVSIQSAIPVTTQISVNGNPVLSSTSNSFAAQLALTSGTNMVQISAIDAAGNSATPVSFSNIILDQVPPSLTIVSPAVGTQYWANRTISISGTASKPLSSALVNGTAMTLSSDKMSFTGSLTATSDGSMGLLWQIYDLAGNNMTVNQSVFIDTVNPVIQAALQQLLTTNQPTLSIPVTILSESQPTSTVTLNGTQILSTSSSTFTASLNLIPGTNTVQIASQDAAGNVAAPVVSVITLDTSPPTLSVTSPAPGVQYLGSQSVSIQGAASKTLASASVNGTTLSLSSDQKSFSGTFVATSDGPLTLTFSATDLAGNQATASQSVVIDSTAPVLSSTLFQPVLTNQSQLSFSVSSISAAGAPVTTSVSLNGQVASTSTSAQSNFTLTLQEGQNTVEIDSTDVMGNAATPLVYNSIELDTTPPVLSNFSPANNASLTTAYIPVSATSSKALAAASINGQQLSLSGDGMTVTGMYIAPNSGSQTLNWSATDLAGNTATFATAATVTIPIYIELGVQDHQRVNQAEFSIPVSILTTGTATTTVFQNGKQIYQTQSGAFQVAATLVSGRNTFEIDSINTQGQTAGPVILSDIVYDNQPPVLSNLLPAPNASVTSLNFPVAGSANKPLSYVKINGQRLALSADGLSFAGQYVANSDAVLGVTYESADLAGNVSYVSFPVTINLGNPAPSMNTTPPTIYAGTSGGSAQGLPNYVLPVGVLDASTTTTTVTQNGVQIYQGQDMGFYLTPTLQPGVNNFQITATDSNGNVAQSVSLSPVTYDPDQATLTITTPTQGQDFALNSGGNTAVGPYFNFTGSSDKALKGLTVNGRAVTLDSSQQSFTGSYQAPNTQGTLGLNWQAVTVAGVKSSFTTYVFVGAPSGAATQDNQPPVVSVDLADGLKTNSPSIVMNVTASDASAVSTVVKVNGQVVTTSAAASFPVTVPLTDASTLSSVDCSTLPTADQVPSFLPGSSSGSCFPANKITVDSTDAFGNAAPTVTRYVIDYRVAPTLSSFLPAPNSLIGSNTVVTEIDYSASAVASHPIVSASLNGTNIQAQGTVALTPSNAPLALTQDGVVNLNWAVVDEFGNVGTAEYPIVVRLEPANSSASPPTIALTSPTLQSIPTPGSGGGTPPPPPPPPGGGAGGTCPLPSYCLVQAGMIYPVSCPPLAGCSSMPGLPLPLGCIYPTGCDVSGTGGGTPTEQAVVTSSSPVTLSFNITDTAPANYTVTYQNSQVASGTATPDHPTFSVTVSPPSSGGVSTVEVDANDSNNQSVSYYVNIDYTPPPPPFELSVNSPKPNDVITINSILVNVTANQPIDSLTVVSADDRTASGQFGFVALGCSNNTQANSYTCSGSLTPPATGAQSIQVIATSSTGQNFTSAPIPFVVNPNGSTGGSAPVITLENPIATNNPNEYTLNVTVQDSATTASSVYLDGNLIQSSVASSFAVTVDTASQGGDTVSVTSTDAFGNQSEASYTFPIIQPLMLSIAQPQYNATFTTDQIPVSLSVNSGHGNLSNVTINGAPQTLPPGTTTEADLAYTATSDGIQTLSIAAQTTDGSTASIQIPIVVNTGSRTIASTGPLPPLVQLTSNPTDGMWTNQSTATLTISVSASAGGTGTVLVNGTQAGGFSFPAGSVQQTFSVPLASGDNAIEVDTTDTNQQSGVPAIIPDIHVSTKSPAVSFGPNITNNILTNNGSFSLPVHVDTVAPVTTKVYIHNFAGTSLAYETNATDFTAPLTLPQATNTIVVGATDVAQNSGSATVQITVDSTPPVLTLSQPTNEIVTTLAVPVAGQANKALASVCLNGGQPNCINGTLLSLTNGGYNFSGSYTVLSEGSQTLQYVATDLAGNQTTLNQTVNIQTKVIQGALISVSLDADGNDLDVVGAMGAARAGANISLSAGFFNSASTQANADGSFFVKTSMFSQALVVATDPNTGATDSANVTYNTQSNLSGTVLSTDGTAINGATISINGSPATTKTNSAGVFSFGPNVPPGDHVLTVDGSTSLNSIPGQKTYSSTNISLSLGFNRNNVIARPIYLAPNVIASATRYDGTQTSSDTLVQNPNLPNVSLDIPAGSATFPASNGSNNVGYISIQQLPATLSTISPLNVARPKNVYSAEPSGTQFSSPVAVTLPYAGRNQGHCFNSKARYAAAPWTTPKHCSRMTIAIDSTV